MEEKNTNLTKPAMTYGLILGLALIIMHVLQYIMDVYKPPFWVSLINYAIIVAVIVYGTIRYRDDNLDGNISYGKALGFGVLTSLFASIIYGLYFFLLTSIIDKGYMEGVYTMIEETYIEMGMTDDQIENAMVMAKKFTNPIFMVLSSIFSFVMMGTVFSLITSIFLKKEKPLFEETPSAEYNPPVKNPREVLIKELTDIRNKINNLPSQYPPTANFMGKGVDQAKQQFSVICQAIDGNIKAIESGHYPDVPELFKKLVTHSRQDAWIGLMTAVLNSDGINELENLMNKLFKIADKMEGNL